ncbi:MAG: cell surface protein SprA, partial [Bacteroidota bacterium]|nr:cell surface protein SprA [Bacteroidota bacterium]
MVLTLAWSVGATKATFKSWNNTSPPDTGKEDQKKYVKNKDLKFPFEDNDKNNGGMYLKTPSNVKSEVDYDPSTGEYKVKQKVGDIDYRDPQYMSFDEYKKYDMDKSMRKYWTQKAEAQDVEKQGSTSGLIPKIHIGGEVFDRIFGSSVIDIRPQGSAELIFAVNSNYRQDPNLSINQRRMTTFDFNEKIQMSVTAKIGDKIEFKTNYNTEASFDFENKMKLAYEGKEDEIIKKIEAGDVSLPLSGSLITGSQALFGIKTQLQFGKTTYTGVFSQQKSQSQVINVAGGAQTNKFNIKADQYEENKHFFIAQYFRDNYDQSLSRLPLISSKINITKIEVWVTNTSNVNGSNRNLVACMDLGEPKPYNKNLGSPSNLYPKNTSNLLYKTIYKNKSIRDLSTVESAMSPLGENIGTDYIKIEKARLLNSTEYSYNPKLGFISLNTALNSNQALAVSFQYTVIGDTTLYQVGEFSNQNADPNTLILKLIKNSSLNVRLPIWNLMMKNVYALGSYQINPKDFRLYVLYSNKANGVPVGYLSVGNIKGQSLLSVMNLDRLNTFGDPYPDGVFDFIDNAVTNGGTIQASNGRIYFPVIEPFGKHLRNKIGNKTIADEYAYDSLYTMTKTGAQQFPDFNRFSLVGSYKSSAGSDISLNAINVPQGSVKVTAGGVLLVENKDYTVDYTIGRVKIINEGYLNSGTPIQISLESNTLFNIQTKTLMGLRVDHKVSKDFTLGGTILHLNERPLTQKVNIGDDPISNTIWGLDGTYQTEAPIITKILDKLPFYNTKEMSKAKFSGEFADLIPGHPSAIGKTGTIYIDDFEGSRSYMDIKNPLTWKLAGTPQKQTQKGMFPEAGSGTK